MRRFEKFQVLFLAKNPFFFLSVGYTESLETLCCFGIARRYYTMEYDRMIRNSGRSEASPADSAVSMNLKSISGFL